MSSTVQVKIHNTFNIEGPNVVRRTWATEIGLPNVYLDGFQYRFSKDLVSTTSVSLKSIFK